MSKKDKAVSNARAIRGVVQTIGFLMASQANVEVQWPSPDDSGNWLDDVLAEQDATLRSLVLIQKIIDGP